MIRDRIETIRYALEEGRNDPKAVAEALAVLHMVAYELEVAKRGEAIATDPHR